MHSVSGINYSYMNHCIRQLRKCLAEFRRLNETKNTLFLKGYIVELRIKQKLKSGVKVYVYKVLEVVNYVDGKRVKKRIRITKDKMDDIEAKLAKKKENRNLFNKLNRNIRYWESKLMRFVKKGVLNLDVQHDIEKCRYNNNNHNGLQDYSMTLNDNRVRSKNECIYANVCYAENYQYYYEKELKVKIYNRYSRKYQYEIIHPDFTHIIDGKAVYVEILGMMDDLEYQINWENRKRLYEENGIKPGRNLVCIVCKSSTKIDSDTLRKTIAGLKEGRVPGETVYV